MKINMRKKEKRYINLKKSSLKMAGRRGFNVAPQSRLVQLSGIKPERYVKRPAGLLLDGNADSERLADSGLARIIEILIYGLGILLISLGLNNIIGKRNGEQYG
ncbi:MAG: hypothetical protein ACC633_05130 [Anaerolineales bacterium]